MQLDCALLFAMLRDKDLVSKLPTLEVVATDFKHPQHGRAYRFICKHLEDHGALPSAAVVKQVCQVDIEDSDVAPGFALAEFLKRKLFGRVSSGIETVGDSLRKNDPEGAYGLMRGLVETIRPGSTIVTPREVASLGHKVIELYEKVKGGYQGVPCVWPSINDTTMGLWPKTTNYYVARAGIGKCASFATLIIDATTGVYKTIQQIVEEKADVFTRDENGDIKRVTPTNWIHTGRKECLRIKLRSGRELSCTPEHPLMTVDGWKRLDEIKPGDHVETVRNMPEPANTIALPEHEVVLLAALLADGSYTGAGVQFTKGDPAIIDKVATCVSMMGADLVPAKAEYQYLVRRRDCRERNPVRMMLDRYGCGHLLSKKKVIPDEIFQLPNDLLAKFLGTFWSCDGSVSGERAPRVELASKVMVQQIQRLLLRFGITSRVSYSQPKLNGTRFDAWCLSVYATGWELFRDYIPLIGKNTKVVVSKGTRADNIPLTSDLRKKILEVVERGYVHGCKFADVSKLLGYSPMVFRSNLLRYKAIPRRTFAAFIDVFNAHELAPLLVNHWDEVVSIEPDGVQEVYDLSVADTHSFVAEDVVCHNTWVVWLQARHAWRAGYRVLCVSPEMSEEECTERFFLIESRVSAHQVLRGNLSDFAYERLKSSIEERKDDKGLYIIDMDDDLSWQGIESAIRSCKPHLVCLDSIYMLGQGRDRTERTIRTTDWLRKISKRFGEEYGTAFVGFHQLSRAAVQSKKAGGVGYEDAAVALTDQIFWDAHSLWIMEQDADMRADKRIRFHCRKVRRGVWRSKPVDAYWDFDNMRFDEIVSQEDDFVDHEFDDTDKGKTTPF